MPDRVRIEVTAELIVNVRFSMEVESTDNIEIVTKKGRAAAERVALDAVGLKGETASASMQRMTTFTVKLI